jgi:hypothetical protein
MVTPAQVFFFFFFSLIYFPFLYFSWPTHSTTATSRPIHATDRRDGIATNFITLF